MTTYHAQVPEAAYRYFKKFGVTAHPIITEAFIPGRGWRRYPINKRVSGAWLRKMRAEGVTIVQLSAGGHRPDFSIRELLGGKSR